MQKKRRKELIVALSILVGFTLLMVIAGLYV